MNCAAGFEPLIRFDLPLPVVNTKSEGTAVASGAFITKAGRDFFSGDDVVEIARRMLGMQLCTRFDGVFTSGIITETEAYAGIRDRASHAYGGRKTSRTEIMYRQGGTAYVYLCYGMHSLFNIVTNKSGIPDAVLIRGIHPVSGIEWMEKRSGKKSGSKGFTDGPGKVSKAMGIHFSHSGISASGSKIWVEDHGIILSETDIRCTPRIGVDYAGEDAKLPWRFLYTKYTQK